MRLFLEDNEVDIIIFSNELLLSNYVRKVSWVVFEYTFEAMQNFLKFIFQEYFIDFLKFMRKLYKNPRQLKFLNLI